MPSTRRSHQTRRVQAAECWDPVSCTRCEKSKVLARKWYGTGCPILAPNARATNRLTSAVDEVASKGKTIMNKSLLLAISLVGTSWTAYAADAPSPGANLEITRINPAALNTAPEHYAESSPGFEIVAGKPKTSDARFYKSADGRFSAGVSTLGIVTLTLTDWSADQFIHLFSGRVEVTDKNGKIQRFGPGDSLIIPKGFSGTWKNLAPLRMITIYYSPTPQ